MDTKKTVIVVIVILVILFFARVFVVGKIFVGFFKLMNHNEEFMAEIEKNMNSSKWLAKLDDNNMPKFTENLVPSEDILRIFDDSDGTIKLVSKIENDNMYDSEFLSKLATVVNEDIKETGDLDLDRIKTDLNKEMERLMSEPKSSEQPSLEESMSLDISPTYKKIRTSVRYWCGLSRAYESLGDTDTALLMSHFCFYFVRELETNYFHSSSLITKMICCSLRKTISDSILIWASNPKPKSKELSKKVAKDILDFLKTEYPLSNSFKYEKLMAKEYMNAAFKTIGGGMIGYCDSKALDQRLDEWFDKPIACIDKPLSEVSDILKGIDEKYDETSNKMQFGPDKIIIAFFKAEKYVLDSFIFMAVPRFKHTKESYELKLARMEVAAIALAINSYYCEKNKLPKSMEELNKWFGEELPKNRFTDEPYEINSDEEHTLINKGIDGVTTSSRDYIFFDFKATKL